MLPITADLHASAEDLRSLQTGLLGRPHQFRSRWAPAVMAESAISRRPRLMERPALSVQIAPGFMISPCSRAP
jgi:hypothetical protein